MHRYTHGHGTAVVQAHALRTAEQYARHFINTLRPSDSILDVGCGPGTITRGKFESYFVKTVLTFSPGFRKYVGAQGHIGKCQGACHRTFCN